MDEYPKKEVCLYGLRQLALIIICKSGVCYSNQAGGNFCLQPWEEGILTIIFDDLEDILKELSEYTKNKICLSAEDADNIDKILWKYGSTRRFSVDRSRLNDSVEAWIYVDIAEREKIIKECENDPNGVSPSFDFWGFTETKGVLTWNNSD
jgi:hypothetical protein